MLSARKIVYQASSGAIHLSRLFPNVMKLPEIVVSEETGVTIPLTTAGITYNSDGVVPKTAGVANITGERRPSAKGGISGTKGGGGSPRGAVGDDFIGGSSTVNGVANIVEGVLNPEPLLKLKVVLGGEVTFEKFRVLDELIDLVSMYVIRVSVYSL